MEPRFHIFDSGLLSSPQLPSLSSSPNLGVWFLFVCLFYARLLCSYVTP